MSELQTNTDIVIHTIFFGQAQKDVTIKYDATVEELINQEGLPLGLSGDGIGVRINGKAGEFHSILKDGNTVVLAPGKVKAA